MKAAIRRFLAFLFLVCIVPAPGAMAEEDVRISRVHPLGIAEQTGTYELVKALLTERGRAVLDEGHNSVIVLDVPVVQESVAALLTQMQGPLPSVRVTVRIVDRLANDAASVSTKGQLLLSYPESSPGSAVSFDVGSRKSGKSRAAHQEILVVSGGSAFISVGREIPYQNWFYSYGRRHGYISRELQWKEVGSRLSVRPVVIDGGRKVRLEVTPEFEYRDGSGGKKKAKKRAVVSYAGAATELVVGDGEEVRIAGSGEREEFYDHFLVGYDRQRRTREVDIFLRATVVTGDSRGAPVP